MSKDMIQQLAEREKRYRSHAAAEKYYGGQCDWLKVLEAKWYMLIYSDANPMEGAL